MSVNGELWSLPEQRVRLRISRVRIPDVVVLLAGSQPDVLTEPPLLVIEVFVAG